MVLRLSRYCAYQFNVIMQVPNSKRTSRICGGNTSLPRGMILLMKQKQRHVVAPSVYDLFSMCVVNRRECVGLDSSILLHSKGIMFVLVTQLGNP